eukprot:Trichotokara_eunicae@DN1085_c0_g1_i1.p1
MVGKSSIGSRLSYAIGVIEDEALYLTPLKDICQFRPTFAHVDEKLKTNARNRASRGGEGEGGEDESPMPKTPKAAQDEGTITSENKVEEGLEEWIKLHEVFDIDSPESHEIFKLLTTYQVKGDDLEYDEEPTKGLFGVMGDDDVKEIQNDDEKKKKKKKKKSTLR